MGTDAWTMTFVGTGSLISGVNRGMPATVLCADGRNYLFDCGDGTFRQLRSIRGSLDIDVVAISSVSSPEMTGLLTLAEVIRRSQKPPLRVLGPKGLLDALAAMAQLASLRLDELLDVREVEPGMVVDDDGERLLEAIEVDRGIKARGFAYLVYESPIPGRVDVEKAKRLGISGSDFSKLTSGQTVRGIRPREVVGPNRRGRRLIVASRGRATESLVDNLQGADVAVFAAPFMDDRLEVAEDAFFMTGWEAAQLSNRANVKVVLLQQLGPYAPVPLAVAEARQFHRNLFAPRDGQILRIPLPDRGEPSFIKHDGTPSANRGLTIDNN